jgi:predicted metal-dependent phosphoesterase TrpH
VTGQLTNGSLPLRTDLHIHTTASDGCWPPERVVTEALAHSIGLIAIADHDTAVHVRPTEVLAQQAGVAFLRGVEVSSRWDGNLLHILAYGFELETEALASLLRANRAEWEQQNEAVIRGLIEAGQPISWTDYETYQEDRTLGGWKPLRFLIDRGLCTGIEDYFDPLLRDLALPTMHFAHPAEVIAAIRGAGGVPVLAHPGESLYDHDSIEATLSALLDLGIAGLECYSQYHDQATTDFYLEWCRQHDLLITGGSDSHGGFVGREVGVPVVYTADLNLGPLAQRIIR